MIILTEVEIAAVRHFKQQKLFDTEEIASKILIGRHRDEYSEVCSGVEEI